MRRKTMSGLLLAAALIGMGGAGAAGAAEPADPLGSMLAEYGKIHEAMADDRAGGVAAAAARIAELAQRESAGSAGKEAYLKLASTAGAMTGSDLGTLRGQFMDVSKAMAALVDTAGQGAADFYYCPMVDAYWLQKKGDDALRNPYYGKSMLRCGEKVARVEG